MSASGITFGGLNSGLDTAGIIDRLVQLESIPLQRLQRRQLEIQQRQAVLTGFRGQINALASSVTTLNNLNTFNPVAANSSDKTVATVTSSASGATGTYELSVSQLATTHKVATSPQGSATEPLGRTGRFVLNGKMVDIGASDSLRSVATKINALGVGVTAAIIDGGTNNAYMTLSAGSSGVSNRIQASDLNGGVLAGLGLVSGASTVARPITNGASTRSFESATSPLSGALGLTGSPTGTVEINGTSVSLDLSVDSLQAVAEKINAANTGATASVVSVSENGATRFRLDLTGSGAAPTLADPNGLLGGLGVLQRSFGNELVQANDARYKLDGLEFTSASNVITSVIPGATVTLLKADATTPAKTTLSLSRDNAQIKSSVKSFMDAYNGVVDYIRSNSKFDTETFESGPLFGDPVARQFEASTSTLVFNNVPGLGGTFRNLASLGFSFSDQGKLELDDAEMDQALAADPNAVMRLFRAAGDATGNGLSYVAAGVNTQPTTTAPYSVNITQVATRMSYAGELAQTAASSGPEKLTFSGSLFGTRPVELNLETGSTLQSTVNKINQDARLKDLVTATIDGGRLRIESKRFGTPGGFTVFSNQSAAADNSGLGVGMLGARVAGLDVAGTINGEPATGTGQLLTGNTGNAKTAGLQISYAGSLTGNVGSVGFSRGVSPQMGTLLQTFTETNSGLLSATDISLQQQLDQILADQTSLNERLTRRRTELTDQFSRMEEAIGKLQSQGQQLQNMVNQKNA